MTPASSIICADGGANRLKDLDLSSSEESRCVGCTLGYTLSLVSDFRDGQIPDLICGDFDSVRSDVLAYYRSKGSKIVEDGDQYSTDLQKCLKQISQAHSSDENVDFVIFGGLGGRADHAFSLIHQLYAASSDKRKAMPGIGDLYLITPESLIFVLGKGSNRISTSLNLGLFTPNVGIIPIARPSVITTNGLEWDVHDWPTEFGGQVSTSNHIVADNVEVTTTEHVLFTMEWATATRQT